MRLPVLFLLMTVMIDAMGIGLIVPVMPALIIEVTGEDLSRAALWGGVLSGVFAVMQFLCAPLLGSLSDRYGRRPVLLIALFFMAVDYVVMALAGAIWLLVVGRIIAGITAATQSAAAACMADLSSADKRAQGFGLISAAFGVGFIIGPMLGGLLGELGTRAPFWAAAILAALNLILGLVVLRETVTDETRRAFDWRRANPFGALRALSRLPGLSRGVSTYFLYQLAFAVYPTIWAYFGQARFGWDAGMIGLSLGVFGISIAISQALVIRPLLTHCGERGTALVGLGCNAVAFTAIAFIPSGWIVLALTPIAALGGVFTPAMQGLLSQQVGPKRQGELQGALSSITSVAMVLAPLILPTVFAAFTRPGAALYFPGAPFLVSLALTCAAFLLFLRLQRR
jgi:DHA1 family tetracycline resistance protein-like MFS transporter